MDHWFNEKTQEPSFKLEKKDLQDAYEIERLIYSKGWKILMKYFEGSRETIMDAGKMGVLDETKRKNSDLKFAMLRGWDQAISLPIMIVDRAKKYKEREEDETKQEEFNSINQGEDLI